MINNYLSIKEIDMRIFHNGWRYELDVNLSAPIEDYDFTVTSITPDGEFAPYPDLLSND